jgi:hypothetical protein
MKKWLKRLVWALALALPTMAAAAWSSYPAALAGWAVISAKPAPMSKDDWLDPAHVLELRRQIQKHFLAHRVYIPLDDIVAPPLGDTDPGSALLLMQKACGRGRLYVWIPLKFKVPLTGEKVIEWCWKPQTRDV